MIIEIYKKIVRWKVWNEKAVDYSEIIGFLISLSG